MNVKEGKPFSQPGGENLGQVGLIPKINNQQPPSRLEVCHCRLEGPWPGWHHREAVREKNGVKGLVAAKHATCVKLLGQSLMARDFDRQVDVLQVRIAVLNGYTALGIPVTRPVE